MRPSSVIVDMAASTGGNCALTRADETVDANGVLIVGPSDLASHVAHDASRMYSRNMEALLGLLVDGDALRSDRTDEILEQARLSPEGGPS